MRPARSVGSGYPACRAYVERATACPAFVKAPADHLAHFAAADQALHSNHAHAVPITRVGNDAQSAVGVENSSHPERAPPRAPTLVAIESPTPTTLNARSVPTGRKSRRGS